MTTYLDYAGRTVDVLAFRGQRPAGETLLTASLADNDSGGEVCTGSQMTAQAWLLEFLREEGSAPYGSGGCAFMAALRQGRMRSELDVYQYFNLSAAKIRTAMRAAESPDDPADERFASATLTRVEIAPGALTLSVTVLTQAGTARKVILPLPLVV